MQHLAVPTGDGRTLRFLQHVSMFAFPDALPCGSLGQCAFRHAVFRTWFTEAKFVNYVNLSLSLSTFGGFRS